MDFLSLITTRNTVVFTVRRSALHGICDRNSVRPSVRLSVTLVHCTVSTWFDLHHDFFTIWQPHHSSFWRYHVRPKIRRGSPRAMALNEGGWVRIGDFRPISRRISETVRDMIKVRLQLITNRKSNTRFQLVPKSTTLVDPEMTLDGNYALCCITHMFFGANH